MLSDEWFSRYGLLENFNASVTRTRTRTGTWTTGVTAIALCTSCSRAKNMASSEYIHSCIVSVESNVFFLIQLYVPFKIINSSYETGQSVCGRKWENPEKNHLAYPQAELGLSHMWPERGSNPYQTQRRDDQVIKKQCLATGATDSKIT